MRSKRENVEAGAKEEQTSPPIHGAGVMDEEQIGRGAARPGEVGSRRPPLWTMGDHPAYIQAAGAGSTAAAPGGAAGNQAPMVQEARSYAGVSSAASSAPGSGNHDANSPARSFDTRTRSERAIDNWWHFQVEYIKGRRLCHNGLGRKLFINCGGLMVPTHEKYLRRFPGTRLYKMLTEKDGLLTRKNFVFLDRHPFACIEILNSYRDGFVLQPLHVAVEVWQAELEYFEFDQCSLSGGIEGLEKVMGGDGGEQDVTELFVKEVGKPEGGMRLVLWKLIEDQNSSWLAWIISTVSLTFVVVSVTIVLVQTIPSVEADLEAGRVLDQLDLAIVIFFTAEYFVRLVLNTDRFQFFKRPLNLVDLISILPTYIELGMGGGNASLGLMRVLRVLRVFKLARHSAGLQVLADTAISARNELFQVFFCFSILAILFAAVVYYTEEQSLESTEFVSIPHSMWWAVITLCTIGYGDMVPATGLGKAVGAMACVSGVVMVALPISVISSTFQAKFQEHTERLKLIERYNEKQRKEKLRLKKEQEEADASSVHRRPSGMRWSRPGTWDVRDFVSSMASRAASHVSLAASFSSDVEGRTRRTARRGSRGSNASLGAQHPSEGGGIARGRRPSNIGSVDHERSNHSLPSGSPAMPGSGRRPSGSFASNKGASGRYITEGLPAQWHGEGPTAASSGVEPQAS